MKLILACLLFVFAGLVMVSPASGAAITWGAATTISGDSDVDNSGTTVYAYFFCSPHDTYSPLTVNNVSFEVKGTDSNGQVPFVPNMTLSGFTWNWDCFAKDYATSLSLNYQCVLNGIIAGNDPSTFTLTGLTIGQGYKVQLWLNQSRDTGSATVAISGGGNSVTLTSNNTGVRGGVGQYTIGTFTADTTTQVITFSPGGGSGIAVNAIQLRTWDGGGGGGPTTTLTYHGTCNWGDWPDPNSWIHCVLVRNGATYEAHYWANGANGGNTPTTP